MPTTKRGWYRQRVIDAGKLAAPPPDEPMDIPMFDAPRDPFAGIKVRGGACGVPLDAWTDKTGRRRPRCNRSLEHPGPHRTYDKKARILAEWEVW